jgi:transposase-like protein
MTKRQDRDSIYVKRQFDTEIIVLCVRWYITYRLSYRDLVAMMAERGVIISHTTIMRWVIRYVPEFEKRWNRFARSIGSSWRVDETYISKPPLRSADQHCGCRVATAGPGEARAGERGASCKERT